MTNLLNFSEPCGVRLMTFGAYPLNCLLVAGAPVFARTGATLPSLEVTNERPQAAPFVALLLGDLRSSPFHKLVEMIVIAEIVHGVEFGVMGYSASRS